MYEYAVLIYVIFIFCSSYYEASLQSCFSSKVVTVLDANMPLKIFELSVYVTVMPDLMDSRTHILSTTL